MDFVRRSWDAAVEAGLEVYTVAEAIAKADIVQILLPDERQAKVYEEEIEPNLKNSNLNFCSWF